MQLSKFCKQCGKKTLHKQETVAGGCGALILALILAVPTVGISLAVFLFIALFAKNKRCQTCGSLN